MTRDLDLKYDINQIVARPLYFGLLVNVLIPIGLLFVCYYIDRNNPLPNKIGDFANSLFFIFCVLAILEAVGAVLWRNVLLKQQMVRREETFQSDLIQGMMSRLRPVFLVIAAISIYGFVYFYLTGRFLETMAFVLFSFLTCQVVRPRPGGIRKLIESQEKFLSLPDQSTPVTE
jgi:hypothetical protein